MIKIAIVDDCEEAVKKSRQIIDSIDDIKIEIIDTFDSGSAFLGAIDKRYDIVILDIDMPCIDGFDVAREIRDRSESTLIMFYTAHEQYVFKSFEFQPFRYIRKEMAENELPFALKCALMQLNKSDNKTILLKTSEFDIKIDIDTIVCVEKYKHNIEISTVSDSIYTVRKTLSSFCDMINDADFIYAHKSAVVNLKYVKKVTPTDIILENDRKIPISRRNYNSVKLEFSKYIGGLL